MSDNPLADWLRERHEALGKTAAAEPETPASTDRAANWPGWATQAADPHEPQPACWDLPPERDGDAPPRRRRFVLLIATLPWLVAGGLGAAALSTTSHQPAPSAGGDESAAAAAGPAPALSDAMDATVGAAAAIAVRLSVTTSGQAPPDGSERRYVDLAVPEAMRWHGDVAVVTVAAVVLEGPAEHWRAARATRFAVPVGLVDGEAVILGDPWVVGPWADREAPVGWQATAADAGAVAVAAEAAGYSDADVREITAHADLAGVLRAEILAHAPGEQSPRVHQLWLRTEPELTVLGR